MKREEKNLQSKQKIIAAALQEFGAKGYAEASLNTICSDGGISKGIIYHYFKDKDELFLVCVQECFEALTAHLKATVFVANENIERGLQLYFDARISFFNQNPLFLKLFCGTVIAPPVHLAPAIMEIRKELDALNVQVFTALLKGVSLRAGFMLEEVIEEFQLYQDFINARYQMLPMDQLDLREHDTRCHRSLNILLYGVVERGCK